MSEAIPFTQYLRPNGVQNEVAFPCTDEQRQVAERLLEQGYRFECEVLTSGEVSLTVADHEREEDIAIEVVPNGPEIPEAVQRLLVAATQAAEAQGGE